MTDNKNQKKRGPVKMSEEERAQAQILYKETLINSGYFQKEEVKEKHKIAQAKYNTKKRLEKLRSGGYKQKIDFTENDLMKLIEEYDRMLNPHKGRPAMGFSFLMAN